METHTIEKESLELSNNVLIHYIELVEVEMKADMQCGSGDNTSTDIWKC